MSSLPSGWSLPNLGDSPDLEHEKETGQCTFQFWVDRIESFYCELDGCSWQSKDSFGAQYYPRGISNADDPTDSNQTNYQCQNIECSCIPDRFLCGEEGSVSESMLAP